MISAVQAVFLKDFLQQLHGTRLRFHENTLSCLMPVDIPEFHQE